MALARYYICASSNPSRCEIFRELKSSVQLPIAILRVMALEKEITPVP